ncbi:sugar phosphate isomerase/epimerase family protein [Streptomyces sp. HNM0645]|uniref:sugar phosphate isomerase/epimerase family protein n=1 Tax=Streptomyces sp. HNM0645 TaxID=2782343 RepID=UPI0024B84E8D|nr:sugar phosphate isomerase/epimerase family protein [Streptomyces sp. HNM0645]MDI9884588.1 sugar phosphate isomerase/epimerase family protein [Streptomyces sp. HNM0645]
MKFAFSTLGVPGMSVPEVAALAASTGWQGVELRVHPEEPVNLAMGIRERAAVVDEFARAGVEIVTVAGYARVAAAGDEAATVEELAELVWMARDLGAPFVRVFPGGGDQPQETADATAARRLAAAAETAADAGVRVLLETHDSHPTGTAVSRIVGQVGHKHVGALWDVLHPWLEEEPPVTTRAALGPYLGCVQVKDVTSAEDLTPLPLGTGILPLGECLALADGDGWVCWEYEKRWHPGTAELPGILAAGREHLESLVRC